MIEAQHLTKRYRNTTAVDEVSFVVQPVPVTGFLGPNGGRQVDDDHLTGVELAGGRIVSRTAVFVRPGNLPHDSPVIVVTVSRTPRRRS